MEELDWFIPYYIDIKLLTNDTHCILSFVHGGRRKSYFVHKYLSSVPIQELSFNVCLFESNPVSNINFLVNS